jgi:peptidoglycan/xylan/chitin deacetylase (PgdA/CDA1 family)
LGNEGVAFGAHTVTHPVLSRVEADRAAQEIRDSGAELAAETGQSADWFCYPQGGRGDFLPSTTELVAAAGYRGCYAAFADPHHDGDALTLPRYSVTSDRTHFLWILCGAEHLTSRWQASGKPKGPA